MLYITCHCFITGLDQKVACIVHSSVLFHPVRKVTKKLLKKKKQRIRMYQYNVKCYIQCKNVTLLVIFRNMYVVVLPVWCSQVVWEPPERPPARPAIRPRSCCTSTSYTAPPPTWTLRFAPPPTDSSTDQTPPAARALPLPQLKCQNMNIQKQSRFMNALINTYW